GSSPASLVGRAPLPVRAAPLRLASARWRRGSHRSSRDARETGPRQHRPGGGAGAARSAADPGSRRRRSGPAVGHRRLAAARRRLGGAGRGPGGMAALGGREPPRTPDGGCAISAPMAVTTDGMLLTAEGQALRLCDLSGRRPARDVPLLGADGTSALGASADGKTLFRSTPEGDVELVRLDGSPVSRFHAHDARIVAMQVTAAQHVLTAALDGTGKGFDGRGGQFTLPVLRGQGRGCEAESLRSAAFSADGTLALVGTVSGGPDCDDARSSAALRLLELPSGQVRWEARPAQVTAALFAP